MLKNIKPKEDVIGLFKEIIKDVYNQQTSEIRLLNNKMQLELEKLLENKKRLLDFYIDAKIGEDMYNLKLSDILEHEKRIKSNLQCNVLTKDDFNTFLSSTLSIIKNIDKIWSSAALKLKKNLQNLIFPNGLNADFKSFQNNSISSIFKQIGSFKEPYIEMVPPSEFESLSTP